MSEIIGDFETKEDHATWLGEVLGKKPTTRTVDYWRNLPDGGLPFTRAGRTPLFCRNWTLEWLASRRQQKNPVGRQRRRAA
jgi:hypothetical protein